METVWETVCLNGLCENKNQSKLNNEKFIIKQIDMYGEEKDIEICYSELEAEMAIKRLNEALPKGVLFWYYKKRIC